VPIFEFFGVDKQLKNAFGRQSHQKRHLPDRGAHGSMHVIDVNSRPPLQKENTQEENALAVNWKQRRDCPSAQAQDMGGIIVVDFIDNARFEEPPPVFQKLKTRWARTC